MTDDQRARLNRFLAERVMGWIVNLYEPDDVLMYVEGDEERLPVDYWEPLTCWYDCESLLDKIEQDKLKWSLDNSTDGGYGCHVWGPPNSGHGWSKASRTEALCLAIARCYGWKEEP